MAKVYRMISINANRLDGNDLSGFPAWHRLPFKRFTGLVQVRSERVATWGGSGVIHGGLRSVRRDKGVVRANLLALALRGGKCIFYEEHSRGYQVDMS